MERIAIIDHETHELYVEDVDEKILEDKYFGQEEEYIKDTYPRLKIFSWDYIVSAMYVLDDGDVTEIDFSEL